MKIRSLVATNIQEVESKKFNIFVPISLGNKWFRKENIREYILWALKYTKENILVIIADRLHTINVEVKDHYSPLGAERKVERIFLKLESEIKEIIQDLNRDDQTKIKVLRWKDIDQSSKYLALKKETYLEFNNNRRFKKEIISIVKDSLKNIENRIFSEEEILRLSEYVLNEIPVIIYGIEYEKKLYNLHPYPIFTKLCCLIDKIENGEFKEFYNRIEKPNGAIAELN